MTNPANTVPQIKSISGSWPAEGFPHFDAVIVINGKDHAAFDYGYGWSFGELDYAIAEPLLGNLNQIIGLMRGTP